MNRETLRYRTIVADPPWRYASAATKADAAKHYSTMTLGDILGLGGDVRALAEPDAHLWLWTTNAFIEEGYDVVRAWGFRPLTLLTWCKAQPLPAEQHRALRPGLTWTPPRARGQGDGLLVSLAARRAQREA